MSTKTKAKVVSRKEMTKAQWTLHMMNVNKIGYFMIAPFMILFFAIYAVFGCILTLTAFFARTQTIDLKISLIDALKAVLLCFFEITFLRFIMAFVRATAFFGYKKKKLNWGRIERKKINVE